MMDRLIIEHIELEDRLKKLCIFIESKKFETLDNTIKALLLEQKEGMTIYYKSLSKRIKILAEDLKPFGTVSTN